MQRRLRLGAALALTLAGGMPALAADVALVLSNTDYATARDLPQEVEAGVDALVAALQGAGYEVHEGRNQTAQEMFELLNGFEAKLADTGRVVIFYAGNPVNAGRETWLTSVDAEAPTPVTASFTGPSLGLLMALAQEAKGRSVVIVEAGEEGFEQATLLKNGVGPVAVPQGVLYVEGPAGGLGSYLAETLFAPGMAAAEATAAMGDPVKVEGTAPTDVVFGPEAGMTPVTPPKPVQPAPVRPPVAAAPQPSPDEAAEAALGLDQRDRARVQEHLAILGFDPRGIDGVFGPNTRAAIAAWQGAEGLPQSGYLKEGQLERLENRAAARARELTAEAERARREAERADNAFWQQTGASGREADLYAYLRRYPDGLHAEAARRQLGRVEGDRLQQAQAQERAAWRAATTANTVAAYRRYLGAYPRGIFAATAAARIEALQEDGKEAAQRQRHLERERALGLSYASRVSIEQRLRRLGYPTGPIDGTLDPTTRAGIRNFQRVHGIAVTGYVNEPTLSRLVAETR
ncbi:MAG TPA: peptidoglycan-binding protein [Paracoccaceae bacterium]|nr:peptidoglycan-binding protein [Paracoccaceae bacterium]